MSNGVADRRFRPLVPQAAEGHSFRAIRRVRLGDANRWGRLRLDSLLRYTQDVSDDDTTAVGLAAEPSWVVRRSEVDVLAPARLAEELTFTTFCSGLGRRWAERRLSVVGDAGAHYEVSTLWVCVDASSGRPHGLTEQFLAIYETAAAGRRVGARLTVPKPPPPGQRGRGVRWALREVDFDVFDHVNNAAYGAVVEERLAESWADDTARPVRLTIEYQAGIAPGDEVAVLEGAAEGGVRLLWWLLGDGSVAAAASLLALPPGLYDGPAPSSPQPTPLVAPSDPPAAPGESGR